MNKYTGNFVLLSFKAYSDFLFFRVWLVTELRIPLLTLPCVYKTLHGDGGFMNLILEGCKNNGWPQFPLFELFCIRLSAGQYFWLDQMTHVQGDRAALNSCFRF